MLLRLDTLLFPIYYSIRDECLRVRADKAELQTVVSDVLSCWIL